MRAAVRTPGPVSLKGVRYEVLRGGRGRGLGQNGGLVAAIREDTGEELWVLKVYGISYDDDLEADKQDILITDLAVSRWSNKLTVRNERGERYDVDLNTLEVARK